MINGTKDWAEAAANGHSPMEAADSAWVRFDPAAVALSLMDDGLTDDEVRTKLRNLIDGGCICVGDLPDLTKLREQWDGEGRRARAHAKTVERLPQTNAPTDGAALLDQVHAFIGRFVAYPSKEAQVAHTYGSPTRMRWMPGRVHRVLAFLSPEPGSGKTRALEVTEPLVPRPVEAVNVSPAYLFRKVADDEGRPRSCSMRSTRCSGRGPRITRKSVVS